MRHTGKLFGLIAAAGIVLGSTGNALAANGPEKDVSVVVSASAGNALTAYFTLTENPVSLSTQVDALAGGTTANGSATIHARDGRLAPDDLGFSLTVDVDDPFTKGSDTFPASAAKLVSTSNVSTVSSNGGTPGTNLHTGTSTGSLADPGLQVLSTDAGFNIELDQTIEINVVVPENVVLGTYTTTLVLTVNDNDPD
jgi:hypothetical protein